MRKTVTALVLGAAVSGIGTMPAAAEETLVYANYLSEVFSPSKADLWFMDEVEKRSNGEITFEKYFSGSLLKAPDLYPGLQNGAADMVTGTPAAYNRGDFRLSNVVLPYISSKADAVGAALIELYESNPDFQNEFASRNAKVLYLVPWAENTFWGSKPLATVKDFDGMKVRGVQAIADSVQKMGATPVAMAWPEAVEALNRGIIDTLSSAPFDSAVVGGVYEIAKVGSDGGGMGIFSFAPTSMNMDRWNELSDEHKKIILEVAAEVPAVYLKLLDAQLQKAAETLCAYDGDLSITPFSAEERAKAQEIAAKPVHAEWVVWAKETNDVDTQALLDQYVSLVRKYEESSTWKDGFERYADCKTN